MKLWLISQDRNWDYDTYGSAVVAAETEHQARSIHPKGDGGVVGKRPDREQDWVDYPELVLVKYIGKAAPGTCDGDVICASYREG